MLKSIHWYRSLLVTLLDGIHPDDWPESFQLMEESCQKHMGMSISQVWASVEEEQEGLYEVEGKPQPMKLSKKSHEDTSHQNPYANIDPDEEEELEQDSKAEEPVLGESIEEIPEEVQPSDLGTQSIREKVFIKKNGDKIKKVPLTKRIPLKTKEQKKEGKKEWKEGEKMSFKNNLAKK